jgi:hypothetical protein
MTWQPIDTHDGSSRAVLVWVPSNKCIYTATWQRGGALKRGWLIFGGGWRDHLQGATHWMPLPEPPAE